MPGKNSNIEIHFILEWILVEIGRREESPVEVFFCLCFFFLNFIFNCVCVCLCASTVPVEARRRCRTS